MNKVLVVNLKRFGDIYQTSHLINSISKNHPGAEISLLVYKQFKKAAKSLPNVTNVYTINKRKLESFYKNDLYNNGLAINEFNRSLIAVKRENWTDVVNYSNDKASTFITTYLTTNSAARPHGVYFSNTNTIRYSNEWACFLNEVLAAREFSPISYNDVIHKVVGVKNIPSGDKIKSNAQHNATAKDNFHKLRAALNEENPQDVSIVGIQLKSSQANKDIPFETIVEFIKFTKSTKQLIPVLLVSPSAEEKEYANKVNQQFDNTLVSIESDLIALPSVVNNLDIVLTPDTLTKHVSDLCGTKVVEASLGSSPTFKQSSINTDSIVLRLINTKDEQTISAKDLFQTVLYSVGKLEQSAIEYDQNLQAYHVTSDEFGTFLTPLNPSSDMREATRLLSRAYFSDQEKHEDKSRIFATIRNSFYERNISFWLEREKVEISECTKMLLRTLRSLIRTQENLKNAPQFVEDLDDLLLSVSSPSIAGVSTLIFRGNIDSLENDNVEENLKGIERAVYRLKNDLQQALHIIRDLEKFIKDTKNSEISRKLQKNIGQIDA